MTEPYLTSLTPDEEAGLRRRVAAGEQDDVDARVMLGTLDRERERLASITETLHGLANRHEWTAGVGACVCEWHKQVRAHV